MLPPAAHYVPDYIDRTHELALLQSIDKSAWLGDLKRRVQHYGFRYDYRARRVTNKSYLGPLPDWLSALADRLMKDDIFRARPDQVIVNEYWPGQGIAPHVDCEPCFGETITSLSLGSTCSMEFSHIQSGQSLSQFLAPRGLLVLNGEARFNWTHGIPARKSDMVGGKKVHRERRVSLTFRTVVTTQAL
ncbi:alpha-ketoglutarate-dependent dioxygenase AlkB [Pelagibacterium nitratireducens]|uniref:Alpha-ketoglutarate-dependent dioxygenase AlkB n=1 Tax=Pelagibacterium nitratireducens TaxID=1046114 RepID=A0ABZ2I5I4_9HYPH